jgi:hypothetical protein
MIPPSTKSEVFLSRLLLFAGVERCEFGFGIELVKWIHNDIGWKTWVKNDRILSHTFG